jgi:arylsulfatase A-like enzyme
MNRPLGFLQTWAFWAKLSESMTQRRKKLGSLLFVALLAARAEGSPGSQRPRNRLDLGDRKLTIATKGAETRPCLFLHTREALRLPATLHKGDALCFALGVNPGPSRGRLRFQVRIDGAIRYDATPLRVGQDWRWVPACVEAETEGPATIEFKGDLVRATGEPFPQSDDGAWIALASPRLEHPAPGRRVLVWISQDTVRADHLEAYGYTSQTTPTLDAFSGQASVFLNATSPSSWTLPALTAQFTSRYPSYHTLLSELGERLKGDSEPDLFEILKREGFSVLGITGNRFVSNEFRLASGFDLLSYAGDDAKAEAVNSLVLAALGEWRGGDVALFVHYMDPHFPYEPPHPFDTLFDPGYTGPATGRNFEQFTSKQVRDLRHVRALYDGELAYTDGQIGALLKELERRDILRGAVVAYSADHGEEFLDHGGWTHGRTVYRELLHIPVAIRVPGRPARRIEDVVSGVDLVPTLLEALGIPAPTTFQGRSLLPLIEGRRLAPQPVFAETWHGKDHNLRVAIRSGDDKYVLVTKDEGLVPLHEEVFDLKADPGEQHPLGAPGGLGRLRSLVQVFFAEAPRGTAQSPAQISDETRRALKALGYVN